jgi:hypothetical protein
MVNKRVHLARKQEVSPVVAGLVILGVLVLVAVGYLVLGHQKGENQAAEVSPGMKQQEMRYLQQNLPGPGLAPSGAGGMGASDTPR